MKILLAGGAGYIGSHTAVEMINAGHEVAIADNFSNSKPEALNRIKKITGKDFAFYEADLCCAEETEKIFSAEHPDVVIHFAGFKAVGESVAKPIMYYRNNIDSTLTLLETMKKYGTRSIVFSSSATVYGLSDKVPFSEGSPVGACTNPYGWTKYMIEVILKSASAADPDLSVVLLRYFNPVGAHESGLIGEDPQGIPNNLMPYISQVAVGRRPELSVFGGDYKTHDGTGVRDYIHVVDLAKGHVAAADYVASHKGTEIFNLGTGVGYSVLDMVHAFEEASGVKIPYKMAPRRAGDADACYSDPSKAEKILGWKAEKTLRDMCADTWRWQKNNPHGYDE